MKYKILLLLSLMLPATLTAQQLVVFSVSGNPQKMEGTKHLPLKVWDILTPSSTINIPYDASIDLIDKEAGRQYHIKTPGNNRLQSFLDNQKNGVKQLTQNYLQYISDQMQGGVKRAARRHSDAATITREVQKYEEENAEVDPWDTDAWMKEFEDFTRNALEEYEAFRIEANQQYADFMAEAWQTFNIKQPIPQPKEIEGKPMVIPQYDKKLNIESRPVKIDTIVMPTIPTPQPLPIEPIVQEKEVRVVEPLPLFSTIPGIDIKDMPVDAPQINPLDRSDITPLEIESSKPVGREILFYGTKVYVRFDDECAFQLSSLSEDGIAELWKSLSSDIYNNTIADCLNIRQQLQLNDWTYLMLLQRVGESLMGQGTNEATLLAAYIYCQSGYKMRLGKNAAQVFLLFASRHLIYNYSYFDIDGEFFYPLNAQDESQLSICTLPFPEEQSLSLALTQEQILAVNETPMRKLESSVAPAMYAEISVNQNLIDLYDNYPTSVIGGNIMSRWAMYANTPMSAAVRTDLYPVLQEQLQGLTPHEAVGKLLNFVQRAFVYEYDEKVWGYDRAFFAEETLFYPYADCEDRSILFSRLVRDLLGLKVALVYYPGHLATAVHFEEDVKGDYLLIDGRHFVICDPTYIGAPVGRTMPNMDNSGATVILLADIPEAPVAR